MAKCTIARYAAFRRTRYACVQLDVRGSGRSKGRFGFFNRRGRRDLYEVIEWIAAQPWSYGKIGGIGQSCYAAAQWCMAAGRSIPRSRSAARAMSGARVAVAPDRSIGYIGLGFWYPKPMFFDSDAWPPPPDGFDPKPPGPRITPAQERIIMRVVGILLLTMFLGPFAGSSIIVAAVAVFRSVMAVGG